jgi:isopenicillin N synthase-like dioxygenase
MMLAKGLLLLSLSNLVVVSTASRGIPTINIAPWTRPDRYSQKDRDAVACAVGKACQSTGFFAVTGHGVDANALQEAWSVAAAFFDLPMKSKLAWKTENEREYPYGYERNERLQLGKLAGDDAPPDLKETFSIGPSNPASGMPPRRFPDKPANFQSAIEAYYAEMEKLALTLLRIFAVALDLPESWFEPKMDHHMGALRLLNYFSLKGQPSGTIRAGPHTDYGALTILKSGGPGLQVKKDGSNEEWVDVPFLQDAFVVNIGDLMQRWTNGTF